VGPGQHREVAVLASHPGECVPNVVQFREEHLVDGVPDEQPVGEVVHVLAGQPEMDPGRGVAALGESVPNEVFDGFDVVVRRLEVGVALRLEFLINRASSSAKWL